MPTPTSSSPVGPAARHRMPSNSSARSGVPVLVVYAQDVDGALADIELTAAAVGRPAEGAALVADMRQAFDEVAAATAGVERPRVFIETGNQPAIYGIADDSVYAEMIELAGGEAVTTGSATNWEMPVERLVAEDPEIILLADAAYGATAEEVSGRPGWDVVSAVRDGAIQPIDDIVLTRPGPRLTEGLQALLAGDPPRGRPRCAERQPIRWLNPSATSARRPGS